MPWGADAAATGRGTSVEFAVPLAPPMSANSPSLRPVTPDNARTVNRPVEEPTSPSLPTRSPSQGPEGGPDRLANALDSALPTRTPKPGSRRRTRSAVGRQRPHPTRRARRFAPHPGQAARRPGRPHRRALRYGTLAVRSRRVLRDRLRAFQAEFRSALGSDNPDRSTSDDNDMHHDATANDHQDDQKTNSNSRRGSPMNPAKPQLAGRPVRPASRPPSARPSWSPPTASHSPFPPTSSAKRPSASLPSPPA